MSSPVHPCAPNQGWHTAWAEVLSELEMDVDRAETLLEAVHRGAQLPDAVKVLAARWSAPSELGPLPHPLLARAQQLLLRHREVTGDLAQAAVTARRHAGATGAVTDRTPSPAVFVDLAM